MKKLHVFDSLKFVRAMFVAVVAIFAFAPAHADTTAIQSVIAYGKTEQNGTPTPANPVPIMTNNGELTVAKNLFDATKLYGMYLLTDTGQVGSASENYGLYRYFDVKPNTTYTFSYVSSSSNQYRRVCGYDNTGTFTELLLKVARSQGGVAGDSIMLDFTTGATTTRIAISTIVEDTDIMLREKKSVYANGLTETIRDAAGHKATAEMLLSAGDYKDEQNITTGAITRKVGVKVLDGSENWIYRSDYNVFSWPGIGMMASGRPTSTHFPYRPYTTTGKYGVGYIYYTELFIKNTDYATLAEFKAYLAEQYANGTPVIVVYPLATETTESVTAQSLTTAPVRQTLGAIMNMPIVTTLTDGTVIGDLIRVATTKYNEESFEDVQGALTGVFNAVDTVVSQTMTQAQAIDTIANNKQTRPDEGCTAKYCLLVEDEQGVPHWYPIAGVNGVAHNLPAGYTELQYLESTVAPTQAYINTGLNFNSDYMYEITYAKGGVANIIMGVRKDTNYSAVGNFSVTYCSSDTCVYSSTETGSTFAGFYDATFGVKHTVKYQQSTSTLLFDNTDKWVSNWLTQISIPYNVYLFAYNSVGTAGGSRTGYVRIYSYSVKNANGDFVQNFVPVRHDSDGVLGMYDLADANPATAFHTNAGTGTFVAGPDM